MHWRLGLEIFDCERENAGIARQIDARERSKCSQYTATR